MTTGWTSYGYGDRVVVVDRYKNDKLMSPVWPGEVVGQGKRGKLRVRLDAGSTIEVYPEQMRHEN
jgi:hypothetical protein